MPRERTCDFTGEEIEPGTGITFVRNDGTVLHFKDSKAEKNYFMGRDARDLEWTQAGRRAAVARSGDGDDEPESEPATEPEPDAGADDGEDSGSDSAVDAGPDRSDAEGEGADSDSDPDSGDAASPEDEAAEEPGTTEQ